MKILILITAFLLIIPVFTDAQQKRKVLMIINEGKFEDLELMLSKEVGVMKDLLQKSGFEVVTASASKKLLTAKTVSLQPDLKFNDVNMNDYLGVIMPCMAVSANPIAPEGNSIIIEAAAKGKPIAAQVGSVVLLSRAGVLKGKKYSFAKQWRMEFKDSIYGGDGVVQDGNIITSGICPMIAKQFHLQDGTAKLTETLINELNKGTRP